MAFINVFLMFLPKRGQFLEHFQGNEDLYRQATDVWSRIESSWPWLLAIVLIGGVLTAWFYYYPFNNLPGRHYKVRYWIISYIVAIGFTFFASLLFEIFWIDIKIKALDSVPCTIALSCIVWAIVLYVITSLIICNWSTTNAYKLLKFTK